MIKSIPYSKQEIDQSDISAVTKALKSPFLTQGPLVKKFENLLAKYCTAKYACVVSSGTSALHLACLALDVTENDIVWTSPISFVASANCALYCKAKIDFIDIDPSTYNISISELEAKLKLAKRNSILPKVLIVVHLAGQSCEMAKIKMLSKKYNFRIIEDASHALGAKYKNISVGSCKYSDICTFSFHPVKTITTGEGGALLTNSEILFRKIENYRSHGIVKDKKFILKSYMPDWYYEQISLGFNYRMNELQASLGLSQLKKIDRFVKKRNIIAQNYIKLLSDTPLILPFVSPFSESSFHLFIIKVPKLNNHISRDNLYKKLKENGIETNLHYIPIYKHPFYLNLFKKEINLKAAEDYYNEALSIPIFPSLTFKQQLRISRIIINFFKI